MSSTVKHVKVVDKMPIFVSGLKRVYDDALGETTKDILINARNRAPFSGKGALRRESDVSQQTSLKWHISFWVEYARFQEFGGDKKRRVRKYTTAGTGAGYLKKSGDEGLAKLKLILQKHGLRVRV